MRIGEEMDVLECKQSQDSIFFLNLRVITLDVVVQSSLHVSELIQDIVVIYTLTKFSKDWLTFTDAIIQ